MCVCLEGVRGGIQRKFPERFMAPRFVHDLLGSIEISSQPKDHVFLFFTGTFHIVVELPPGSMLDFNKTSN